MTTLVVDTLALRTRTASVSEDALILELADRRTVSAPLTWYPRLLAGSPAERANLELIGHGEGVHWPDLDEDLSVESVPAGRPSSESPASFGRWLAARPAMPTTV